MARRSRSREVALQLLYMRDQNKGLRVEESEEFIERRILDDELRELARSLYTGAQTDTKEIDKKITAVAENWSVERMAVIDRNLLRLGIYEMLYKADSPPKVIIDEAVELAKRYGTEDSAAFVNGILDKIANDHQKTIETKTENVAAVEDTLPVVGS